MSQLAILDAFAELQDPRRRAGQRHNLALCLALFTLAIYLLNLSKTAIAKFIHAIAKFIHAIAKFIHAITLVQTVVHNYL